MQDSLFPRALAAAFLAALLPAALLLTSCDGRADADHAFRSPNADDLRVARSDLVEEILLTGTIAARDAVPLSAPNANIWPMQIRHLVEDGTFVKADEVVAEFDNSQLVSQLEQFESLSISAENELHGRRAGVAGELANAVYAVEQARAQLEKARLEAELPEGLLAEQEYARRKLALRRAEIAFEAAERQLQTTRDATDADLKILEVSLEKARDEAEKARYRMELLTLRAPRDGILLVGEDWNEGRLLQIGDNVFPGAVVATLPDLETLYVEADLFDVDDGRVSLGVELTATLDALPGQAFEGRVISVDEVAQSAGERSSRSSFGVGIELDGLDPEKVRPGMSVKVVARHVLTESALLVPRAALDWSGEAPRAALAGGGYAEFEIGACNAHFCEARSGLEEGRRLRRAEG